MGFETFRRGVAHLFCSKKESRWTLSPEEAVLAFLVPFCARQDDGGEEGDHRKQEQSRGQLDLVSHKFT